MRAAWTDSPNKVIQKLTARISSFSLLHTPPPPGEDVPAVLTALLPPPSIPDFLLLLQQRTGSSSQPPCTWPACRPPGHCPPSPGHRELSNFSESLQLPLPLYIQHLLLLLLSHFSHVCDPTDGSPPGSTIPGVLQTRTLEWVAISFSNA